MRCFPSETSRQSRRDSAANGGFPALAPSLPGWQVAAISIAELPLVLDREKIAAFCRERGIRRLSLFGSVLRDDFNPARSDVDVLAEFNPGAEEKAGWDVVLYGEQPGAILGHPRVDFCTQLRPWLQPLVEKRALVIYDESVV